MTKKYYTYSSKKCRTNRPVDRYATMTDDLALEILGVGSNPTIAELNKAMRKAHPDIAVTDARFINEAYELIKKMSVN